MPQPRRMWLALELLDRQIVDREDRNAGNVDDIDLQPGDDGALHVHALLSGPGLLAQRMRQGAVGRWLQRTSKATTPGTDQPGVIPFDRVVDVGAKIRVDADARELSSYATERWVQDHVIDHIPGSRHAPE